MRTFFSLLTIGLILVGFFVPIAWIAAIITGLFAIISAPSGRRLDGKRKTGGLFGGVWDGFIVRQKMMDCPYCKSKIMRDAQKCPYCSEWIIVHEEPAISQNDQGTQIKTMKISGFHSINL